MVTACVQAAELHIPVTCKVRLQPTLEATIEFCQRLERAGCALVAVHGRFRGDEKHRRSGAADLHAIRAIKAALSIPVLSNGNVSSYGDAIEALRVTGADGVMAAEEILRDPALFDRCDRAIAPMADDVSSSSASSPAFPAAFSAAAPAAAPVALAASLPIRSAIPDVVSLSDEYLSLCLLHPPSSVWTIGASEDGPGEVARQHLTRMLRFQAGARGVLTEQPFLASRSVPALVAAFRRRPRQQQQQHAQPAAGRAAGGGRGDVTSRAFEQLDLS